MAMCAKSIDADHHARLTLAVLDAGQQGGARRENATILPCVNPAPRARAYSDRVHQDSATRP
jgi:hypothetical protein